MKSYLVTGGAGFIGANLVRKLNQKGNSNIIIVDNIKKSSNKKVDILKGFLLLRQNKNILLKLLNNPFDKSNCFFMLVSLELT